MCTESITRPKAVCVYNSARLARSLALLHIMYVNEMYALSLCVHVYIRRCVCCVYTRSALSGSMNGVFGGFGGGVVGMAACETTSQLEK